MKEVKVIKCNKCGFENVYGTKKCMKCKTALKTDLVCPRCAKKNLSDAKHCVNCGYSFERKKGGILFNLILSILLVVSLLVVNHFDPDVFSGLTKNMKRVAVFVIIIILIATLTYGKKEINHYSAEEEMMKNSKMMKVRKVTSIILGLITAGIFIFVCFKYLIK